MNLQTCLKLAKYAKKDPSLIKNHTDGPKGVDHYLRGHLDETKHLIGIVDGGPEFTARLKAEEVEIISALAVYTSAPLEWDALWTTMKAEPDAWQPTTLNMYDEMLGAVPPQDMAQGAFLVGEPERHNSQGEAVYACFKTARNKYEARYMTQTEFNQLKQIRI